MAVVAGAFMCICRSYSSSSCRIFSYLCLYCYNSQHSSITLSDYAENADEAERRQQRRWKRTEEKVMKRKMKVN